MITRAATPLIKMMTSDSIPPTTEAVSCPPLDVASSRAQSAKIYDDAIKEGTQSNVDTT